MDYLASRGVKNRCRGRWRPLGNFLVGFKSWEFHGVLLGLIHTLLGPRVVSHTLLCWGVPMEGGKVGGREGGREGGRDGGRVGGRDVVTRTHIIKYTTAHQWGYYTTHDDVASQTSLQHSRE